MRVLCLTTETKHHNYFLRQLAKSCNELSVIIESESIRSPYLTQHKFEEERERLEAELWGAECAKIKQCEISAYLKLENINELKHSSRVKLRDFDLCVVFGTRKINASLIKELPQNSFNLHGGDPNYYRGLDSHLWSIWHGDTRGMKTCLHRLSNELDEGEIFQMQKLDLTNIFKLCQIRSVNTQICVELTQNLINALRVSENINLNKQHSTGRYYSFMPSDLKTITDMRFPKFRELMCNED